MVGAIQAKLPATLATPPLNWDVLNACPTRMVVAVGTDEMVGLAFATTKFTVLVTGET